jgi:hypothetical protein
LFIKVCKKSMEKAFYPFTICTICLLEQNIQLSKVKLKSKIVKLYKVILLNKV